MGENTMIEKVVDGGVFDSPVKAALVIGTGVFAGTIIANIVTMGIEKIIKK